MKVLAGSSLFLVLTISAGFCSAFVPRQSVSSLNVRSAHDTSFLTTSPSNAAASVALKDAPESVDAAAVDPNPYAAVADSVPAESAAAPAVSASQGELPMFDRTPVDLNNLDQYGVPLLPPPEAPPLDLDVVALVAGQENYGLAIVALGEALWSFLQAPSLDHALKTFGPATVAAIILVAVSGPMVTSGNAESVTLGLEIATAVSMGLGASYLARLLAPYSPSPKEIAFLGLLISLAGFFSFSQNLLVDGFITLPQLPSIPLPQLPSINLDFFNFD